MLTSGDWIDEVEPSQKQGISRTPLREALKVLNRENLASRKGCRVKQLHDEKLLELFPAMTRLGVIQRETCKRPRQHEYRATLSNANPEHLIVEAAA